MSTSREKILSRLRAASSPLDVREPDRALPVVPLDDLSPEGLRLQFVTQAEKLACIVHQPASDADAVQTILGIVAGNTSILSWGLERIPLPGLAGAFAAAGIEITQEPDASARVGLTGVDAALAATGSLVLMTGVGKPRAASLLVPVHIALMRASQITPDLETWMALQRENGIETFRQTASAMVISGPSRTADIAMQLILGMHGPGEVHVVLCD